MSSFLSLSTFSSFSLTFFILSFLVLSFTILPIFCLFLLSLAFLYFGKKKFLYRDYMFYGSWKLHQGCPFITNFRPKYQEETDPIFGDTQNKRTLKNLIIQFKTFLI